MSARRAALLVLVAAVACGPARADAFFNWNQPPSRVEESPIPTMSKEEYSSFLCMVGGAVAGGAAVLAGSAAIIATGASATTTETAVAVPVLVATIAAGCGLGTAMAPAFAWLHHRGDALVREIEGTD
ncbi:hypothetical protein [Azospirillum sp. ST 5-10]|uniref:hypothetical protein n=1 Tax=unclassified Azospirillum TaxID=2630922 RepID=UPI003F49DCE3